MRSVSGQACDQPFLADCRDSDSFVTEFRSGSKVLISDSSKTNPVSGVERSFDNQPYRCHERAEPVRSGCYLIRLYEQLRQKKVTPEGVASALGRYVKRWRRWTRAGLGELLDPQIRPAGCYRQPARMVTADIKPRCQRNMTRTLHYLRWCNLLV